jgi:hypothetical protein
LPIGTDNAVQTPPPPSQPPPPLSLPATALAAAAAAEKTTPAKATAPPAPPASPAPPEAPAAPTAACTGFSFVDCCFHMSAGGTDTVIQRMVCMPLIAAHACAVRLSVCLYVCACVRMCVRVSRPQKHNAKDNWARARVKYNHCRISSHFHSQCLFLSVSLSTHTCTHACTHTRARANTFIMGSVKCAYTLEASMAGGYIDTSGASSSYIDNSEASGSCISSNGASGTDSTDGATRCHCHFSPTMLQGMGKQFLLGFLVSDWYTCCATHAGSHTANTTGRPEHFYFQLAFGCACISSVS